LFDPITQKAENMGIYKLSLAKKVEHNKLELGLATAFRPQQTPTRRFCGLSPTPNNNSQLHYCE